MFSANINSCCYIEDSLVFSGLSRGLIDVDFDLVEFFLFYIAV